jgi:hypothetical protein
VAKSSTAELENPVSRARLVTALGKQRSGKTYLLRWFIERSANARRRPMKLIDADPHNDTLRRHYTDAVTPGSSALEDRRISLQTAIREQHAAASAGTPYDALWDIGGGDLLMARLAREVRFSQTVDQIGIDLIVFYMLSPSLSDLEYFQMLEDAGFRPKNLCLIFNAGLIQGDRRPDRAFDAVLAAPLVKALTDRGARALFMPALASDTVEAIEATGASTFRDALQKLDIWDQMRVQTWLDEAMETEIAKPLAEWGWLL